MGGIPLLATVCNTVSGAVPYALWLSWQGQEYLVDLSDVLGQPGDVGLTGIVVSDDRIVLAVQSSHPRILILDRHLAPVGTVPCAPGADLHSLHALAPFARDGALIAVATGHNAVLRIDPRAGTVSDFLDLSPGTHTNSVCFDADALLVCSHTLMPLAKGARRGGIFNITTRTVVLQDMINPHSILATPDGLLVLDSGNECLIALNHDGTERRVTLTGFLRGAVICGRSLFVAGCPGREVSRKTNAATPPRGFQAAMGERNLIFDVDLDSFQVRSSVSPLIAGYEIYDLATLDGLHSFAPDPARLLVADVNAIARLFYGAAKRAAQTANQLAVRLKAQTTPPAPP